MALAQLNRDVEKRSNQEPVLGDLRESGSLEQDADIVIFPFVEGDEFNKEFWLKVGKHRRGKCGKFEIKANEDMTRFWDETGYESEPIISSNTGQFKPNESFYEKEEIAPF